jgi:hypothetical protein
MDLIDAWQPRALRICVNWMAMWLHQVAKFGIDLSALSACDMGEHKLILC